VIFAPEDSPVTQQARVATYYLLEECFTFTIWSARLSILFTIIRITPVGTVRRTLYVVAIVFGVFALVLGAQKFWVCIPQPGWADTPGGGTCNLGKQVALAEIITDVIGDIVLVIIPVKLLWRIRVERSLRIRLITVFSMSLIITIASLAQDYYLIHEGGIRDFIVSHVELETAVTICNLNVLVAAIYRYKHKTELGETGDAKSPTVRVGFTDSGWNRPLRRLPVGYPPILGPPLAVAVGGLTTGGPLGGVGVNGGIRVDTEVSRWTHLDRKDGDGFGGDSKHLDLEGSDDGTLDAEGPRHDRTHSFLNFERDLERGEAHPMIIFPRSVLPVVNPASAVSGQT